MESMMKGALLATMAGGFFLGCASSGDKTATNDMGHDMASGVMCAGVNGCGGKGACGGADNACKGQNECKGKGWVTVGSAQECTDQGGTVVAGK